MGQAIFFGLSWSSNSQESACNAGDLGSIPGSGRFLWRREWQSTPVFLLREFHRQRSLEGYSSWGRKQSDMTERLTLISYIFPQAALSIPKALKGFPGGSDGKESAWNERDLGLIPGLERSPGGGHGHPLQYSCLENPHRQKSLVGYRLWYHKESDMTEQLTFMLKQ